MKRSALMLIVLGLSVPRMSGSEEATKTLLALLRATENKNTVRVSQGVKTTQYGFLYTLGAGALALGMTTLGYLHIAQKVGYDAYDPEDNTLVPVSPSLHETLYSLLLDCGFSTQEADAVGLYLQVLPKDVYGYADYTHNRIILNAQWCMLEDFYTNRFDKAWARLVSWCTAPGLKFIFCHEALHLKKHTQVTHKASPTHMRTITLFCEMEADLAALDVLLKKGYWGAVGVSMIKVALDSLRSVSYGSWAPSAYDRYRYWKQFCIDFIKKKEPCYQEYANNYIEELED